MYVIVVAFGVLTLVAGLFFAAIGRSRFVAIMSWALTLAAPVGRLGGVIAIGFGGFLVYAFVQG